MNDRKAPRWARWHGRQAAPNVTPDPSSAIERTVAAEIAEEQQRRFLARVTGSRGHQPWHRRS